LFELVQIAADASYAERANPVNRDSDWTVPELEKLLGVLIDLGDATSTIRILVALSAASTTPSDRFSEIATVKSFVLRSFRY
jgi:hypothetical protein